MPLFEATIQLVQIRGECQQHQVDVSPCHDSLCFTLVLNDAN